MTLLQQRNSFTEIIIDRPLEQNTSSTFERANPSNKTIRNSTPQEKTTKKERLNLKPYFVIGDNDDDGVLDTDDLDDRILDSDKFSNSDDNGIPDAIYRYDDNDSIIDVIESLGFDPTDTATYIFSSTNFSVTPTPTTAVLEGTIITDSAEQVTAMIGFDDESDNKTDKRYLYINHWTIANNETRS